jgi:hypothetical protein
MFLNQLKMQTGSIQSAAMVKKCIFVAQLIATKYEVGAVA